MTARTHAWILGLLILGCELPEPAGPTPTGASITGATSPSSKASKTSPIAHPPKQIVKPRTTPQDPPADRTDPPAPTGKESGPLVGLRAAHDQARASVGVPALQWSDTLGAYAQEWANQLAANGCQLSHRSNSHDATGLREALRQAAEERCD